MTLKPDFWSIQGDFIYRHHNETRVQLHVPKEETFPSPPKYIDVTRSIYTDLDAMQEKRVDDHWNVDSTEACQIREKVPRSSLYLRRSLQKDVCGPGRD